MLLNPPSEQEIALKKQQEQAMIDATLERMFPTETKLLKEKSREELLQDSIKAKEKAVESSESLLKNEVKKDYLRSPYDEIDAKKDWSDELKAQKKAEVAKIQKEALDQEREINREHAWKQFKNYGGALLEIGSAAVPGYGGAMVTGKIASKIAPKVGRKIAKEIELGMLKGASSGTVEGFGRGLLEDENPLKTAAQNTLAGAVLEAGLGTAGASVEKAIRGNKLKHIEDLKTLRRRETDFYKEYIQGTQTNHSKIGDIDYTQAGLETVSKQPNAGRNFSSLKKDLKNAEYINYEKPHHKKHGVKDNIRGFYKLKNNDNEFLIADTPEGAKYYMSKELGDISNRPSRVEPIPPNNIVTPSQTNLNPSQQSIQKPQSYAEWLEELKRRRKQGWW